MIQMKRKISKFTLLIIIFALVFLNGVGRARAIPRTNFNIEINPPLFGPRAVIELPPTASFFDVDGSGRIELTELFEVVRRWIDAWRDKEGLEKADLNGDGECNLIDLSILLYYVGR